MHGLSEIASSYVQETVLQEYTLYIVHYRLPVPAALLQGGLGGCVCSPFAGPDEFMGVRGWGQLALKLAASLR